MILFNKPLGVTLVVYKFGVNRPGKWCGRKLYSGTYTYKVGVLAGCSVTPTKVDELAYSTILCQRGWSQVQALAWGLACHYTKSEFSSIVAAHILK